MPEIFCCTATNMPPEDYNDKFYKVLKFKFPENQKVAVRENPVNATFTRRNCNNNYIRKVPSCNVLA